MKKLLIFIPIVALIGCAAMDKALLKPIVTTLPPQVISTNITLVTNLYAMPASTNAVTGQVVPEWTTAIVTPQVVYSYAPSQTHTNWVVRPEVETGISVVGSLPVPYAGLAAIAAGWLATLYANIRNKRAAASLVTGIEAVREGLQTTPEGQKLDQKIKQVLIEKQELAGTLNTVSKLVNDLTGNTTKSAENLGDFVAGTPPTK